MRSVDARRAHAAHLGWCGSGGGLLLLLARPVSLLPRALELRKEPLRLRPLARGSDGRGESGNAQVWLPAAGDA